MVPADLPSNDLAPLRSGGLPVHADDAVAERMALVRALDMASLWQACSALISKALPCHSCSLLFDIDGLRPHQGRHHLADGGDGGAQLVTSLEVAAPYLDANPRIPWYTFSQIASNDAQATERLKAQDPARAWSEFIHLAFWNEAGLEAVLSVRMRAGQEGLSARDQAFLVELYPLLDASLQRVRALERDRARQQSMEALVHGLPIAAILVDERLVPFYVSMEARRICQRWSDVGTRAGHLPEAIELPLRRWLEGGDGRPAGPVSPVGRGGGFGIQHHRHPGLRLHLDVSTAGRPAGRDLHHLLVLTPVETDGLEVAGKSSQALASLRGLSPSERKVAMLVAAGLSNEQVAQRLCRSRKTIESQISSIYRKLNVANRTQLARLLG